MMGNLLGLANRKDRPHEWAHQLKEFDLLHETCTVIEERVKASYPINAVDPEMVSHLEMLKGLMANAECCVQEFGIDMLAYLESKLPIEGE